jgi:uncharacterized damage-inducible protein DinB
MECVRRFGDHHGMASLRDHYVRFAAYNTWANLRLYAAAAALSDDEYRADRGAFFRSLHGTLNHLLVTDQVWMQRFTSEGSAPDQLDAILFERLADLDRARRAMDARIERWIATLDDAAFDGVIRYRRVSTPELMSQPLAPALAHWFNHQTHHRGQAHAILTSLGRRAPELDFLYFDRETRTTIPAD